MNRQKGFTLIELLVVIAIIGILSAVVLTNLGSARGKANDAKIQGQLSEMRAGAESYYSTYNHYGTSSVAVAVALCGAAGTGTMWSDTSSGLSNLTLAANYPNGAPSCAIDATPASKWASWHVLGDGSFFCVDSTGAARKELASFTAPTVANPTCQ